MPIFDFTVTVTYKGYVEVDTETEAQAHVKAMMASSNPRLVQDYEAWAPVEGTRGQMPCGEVEEVDVTTHIHEEG